MGGEPLCTIGRERSRRDEAVEMAMRAEGLIPGVQDHRAADLPTKIVVATLEECLPHSFA